MRCESALPRLWDLADAEAGGLDPRVRRELEAHVASCARCAGRLASILETDALLARVMPPAPPAGRAERLHEVVLARAASRPRRRWASLASAAAGLAALSFAAFQWLSFPESSSFLARMKALPEAVLLPDLPPVPDLGAAARIADVISPLAVRLGDAWRSAALPSRLGGLSAAAVVGLLLMQIALSARLLASRRREAA